MAIKILPNTKGARAIQQALMAHFDWSRNRCFPNVCCFPWESDLLVVSEAGYATEVEVKISLADWRADLKKDKWTDIHQKLKFEQHVKKFFYAVPEALVDKAPEGLPQFAGILGVTSRGRVSVVREAANLTTHKLPDRLLRRLEASIYYRFSRQFMCGVPFDLEPLQPIADA